MKAPKSKAIFICQQCGFQTPRWAGRCPDCSQWNSLKEEVFTGRSAPGSHKTLQSFADHPTPITEVDIDPEPRCTTHLGELDRVLGGGVVPGSVILIGGDPGIGKTTLLLQTLHGLGQGGQPCLYVSGEESPRQLKMRGDRLGISSSFLYILAETALDKIIKTTQAMQPAALVVDSIQTVYTDQITSAPGSASQVQEVACQLMWYAKRTSMLVFLIGHVTKEGMIAGPKLLEHIVDTVLYFEGEKGQPYRILRAVKNRFGATNEIGVFEMKDAGLEEVANPSELFLAGRPEQSIGSVVVSTLEGSRPILVELQALVTSTGYAMPKRMANGVEVNRVALLLAVMEKRLGLHLSGQDVYFNVVGGLRLDEPAIDVGIVAAVVSSFRDQVVDTHTVWLGEVGLGGEIRPVTQVDVRTREAMKLGFQRCLVPAGNLAKWSGVAGLDVIGVRDIGEVWDQVMAHA